MFVKLLLLLSIVAGTSTHRIPEDRHIGSRIYGGADTRIDFFPWQASLQKNNRHDCGGAIYSRNFILTAAHCITDTFLKELSIRVGATTLSEDVKDYKVVAALTHERYSPITGMYDLAVLRLGEPLKMNRHVQGIKLARRAPVAGTKATVSGWGVTEQDWAPDTLKSVEVSIVGMDECKSCFGDKFISEATICAAAAGKDACQGDSGGPLVSNGELVGIVAWGVECADPNHPGVYTNIAKLRRWILSSVAKLSNVTKLSNVSKYSNIPHSSNISNLLFMSKLSNISHSSSITNLFDISKL